METAAAELSGSGAPGGDAPDSTVSASPVAAAAPPAGAEGPATVDTSAVSAAAVSAEDDAEKAELRRQLQRMDEQLKELAVQNRTVRPTAVTWGACLPRRVCLHPALPDAPLSKSLCSLSRKMFAV